MFRFGSLTSGPIPQTEPLPAPDLPSHSVVLRFMKPAGDATPPVDVEGVSCEGWGIRVQHPDGAMSHLPSKTELNADHVQALHELADLAVRVHRHHSPAMRSKQSVVLVECGG